MFKEIYNNFALLFVFFHGIRDIHLATMTNSFTIPNISHLVSIKLDRTNYILWLAQFLPFLRSTDLIGFVDGTKPCLEKFLLNAEKKITNSIDLDFIKYINSTSH